MTDYLEQALGECRPAFRQDRTFVRAITLAVSALACLGRRTVTGMLVAGGHQSADWSAAYRLFERERLDQSALWAPLRRGVGALLEADEPFVAAIDDTLLPRRGRKVVGASWRRDPQGPPFQTNLIWSQRFLQAVVATPEGLGPSRARAIPVGLWHCPGAPRPPREASPAQMAEYRVRARQSSLSAVGASKIQALRQDLDAQDVNRQRQLIVAVDGGYTNGTVLRGLPERTCLVGRIRKDARLFSPPSQQAMTGRRRVYGAALPTPEELRQDETVPWQSVEAWGAGRIHSFDVKTMTPVRWKGLGPRDMRIVVVRPLAYRPKKGSKLLYRQAAYLLCTDPDLPLERLLQSYLWRWEVEVAFREEKTLLGMGQAQVRTQPAVETVPTFIAVAYGYLHLAALRAGIQNTHLVRPSWHKPKPQDRCTTAQLISLLRAELWGRAIGNSFNGFVNNKRATRPPQNQAFSPYHAAVYAHEYQNYRRVRRTRLRDIYLLLTGGGGSIYNKYGKS